MESASFVFFPPFRFDLIHRQLWRGSELVPLRPKTLAVLYHLIDHAGQVVTREEFLQAVWPKTYVSKGSPKRCIQELRAVLGDDPVAPRFVATVGRQGYRFIAPLSATQPVRSREQSRVRSLEKSGLWTPDSGLQDSLLLVGRDAELAQLHGWLDKAVNGERQIVFVTGEPGIGKTTLVDAFLERLETGDWRLAPAPQASSLKPQASSSWIARGQCVEHYGAGEAYLPVFEALGRLCREPEGERCLQVLRHHAPMWLLQMPTLLSEAEFEQVQRRVQGATQERMLRELAEAVEVLTNVGANNYSPLLILVLEDLHWSDVSTLDLIAYLARRREPARLLVIGTYRPVEGLGKEHPLHTMRQELHLHHDGTELPLEFLTEAAVSQYLMQRFGAGMAQMAPLQDMARMVHRRTEGNPLFMVNVVDFLVAQRVIVSNGPQGFVQEEVGQSAVGVPDNIRQMIERQIEHLSVPEQRVLEVASVAGTEFSAAAVAAGLGADVWEVEGQCTGLVRRERVLHTQGASEWPDGTVTTRYRFVHALYQDVLYECVPVAQRVRYHQRIGERVEQGYGERAGEIAAELARHFEQGRDFHRAVHYLLQAAENSIRRYAYREPISHVTKGLVLLTGLPDTPERRQQEFRLRIILGMSLIITQGFPSPDVRAVYTRALELGRQLGESWQLFPVLVGLWQSSIARAEHRAAYEFAEHMLSVARQEQDRVLLLQAHSALRMSAFLLGKLTSAREHWEERPAPAGCDQRSTQVSATWLGPGIIDQWDALVLWQLGYPDQAREKMGEVLADTERLSHLSLAATLFLAAVLYQLCRDTQRTREQIEALIALGTEHGFPFYLALSAGLQGWVLTEQGEEEAGIAQMRQGLATYQASGAAFFRPYWLALLAKAYGNRGQTEEALNVVDEALAAVNTGEERFYEAELWRLKGELRLQCKRQTEARVEDAGGDV